MAFRRKLIEIQKKPMNVQLSLADFYRIGLEKDYEVGISTTISNNTPNSSKIAKKQTPVKTSISTNANISSIETSSKILLPGTSLQASMPSGDLNKTIGKARNLQEIAKPPSQQEANKTPKKLMESSVQASSAMHSANWNRTFSNPMDSPEIAKQQKEERYNKSVASLDALSNLKQVLQSPVVQAPIMTGDRNLDRRSNSLEMDNYYNPPIKQTIIINPNYVNPRTNMKRKLELPINQPDVGDSTFFTGISKPFNNSAISQPSQESVNAEWANEFLNRCNERKNEYRGGYWTDEYGLLKPQQQLNQIAKPYQGLNHLLYCRQISVQT